MTQGGHFKRHCARTCRIRSAGRRGRAWRARGGLGRSRACLLVSHSLRTGTSAVSNLEEALGDAAAGTYSGMPPHTPREAVIECAALARESRADIIVTLGGGSLTDAGKVVQLCLEHDVTEPDGLEPFITRTGSGRPRGEPRDPGATGAAAHLADHALRGRVRNRCRLHRQCAADKANGPAPVVRAAGRGARPGADLAHARMVVALDRCSRGSTMRLRPCARRSATAHIRRARPACAAPPRRRPAAFQGGPCGRRCPAGLSARGLGLDVAQPGCHPDGREPRHRSRPRRHLRSTSRAHVVRHATRGPRVERRGESPGASAGQRSTGAPGRARVSGGGRARARARSAPESDRGWRLEGAVRLAGEETRCTIASFTPILG